MHWDDVEEIAHELEEEYNDEDIDTLSLVDLKQLITALNDFEDEGVEVSKGILEEILDKWKEIREEPRDED